MEEDSNAYGRSCYVSKWMKRTRHATYGLLHPLEYAYAPWQSISMDFIVELLISMCCSQIWIVVNYFTKITHFIPIKDNIKRQKTRNQYLKGKFGAMRVYQWISSWIGICNLPLSSAQSWANT
jgi:hypothetical protein